MAGRDRLSVGGSLSNRLRTGILLPDPKTLRRSVPCQCSYNISSCRSGWSPLERRTQGHFIGDSTYQVRDVSRRAG